MSPLAQAKCTFFIGLAIFVVGIGGPMLVYAYAGGGEMGVEGVAMLGLLPVMFIGFWLGLTVMIAGGLMWAAAAFSRNR